MGKIAIGIMIGILFYIACSVIVDAIILFTNALNKKQIGALGVVFNMILMVTATHFRDVLQAAVGNVWFWISLVCLLINVIIGFVQLMLGMMSANPNT